MAKSRSGQESGCGHDHTHSHAFECKPVKASFAAFSENIQLKKALHYLTKSYLAIVVFKRRKFSTLKTFFCTGYQ